MSTTNKPQTKYRARIEIKHPSELPALKPGQFISLMGTHGRYFGSNRASDVVLWKKTGSPKFSRHYREFAKRGLQLVAGNNGTTAPELSAA